MNFRTDLALERTEPARQTKRELDGCTETRIDEDGKTYITLEVQSISDHIDADDSLLNLLAGNLKGLLPREGLVLAAGLGNRAVTPDALGPLTADRILATRHIRGELARVTGLGDMRPVAVASPGVLGTTGVEAFEVLKALVGALKPVAVVNGKKAAQLMILAGCDDDGTLGFPNWQQNLRLALRLQQQLSSDWPGVARPLDFCARRYNEDMTAGSLLIEVGTDANALSEAQYTGELLGSSLARVLTALR